MLGLSSGIVYPAVLGESFTNAGYGVLDGTNDYVSIADADNLTPNNSGADRGFSISMWVYYKNTSNPARGEVLVSKHGAFSLGAYRYEYKIRSGYDQKPFMQVYGNTDVNISQTFKLDLVPSHSTWYHLVWCWNLGTGTGDWKAFVNGEKQTHGDGATHSSAGTWAAVTNTPNTFLIGLDTPGTSNYSNINVDEYAVFDDNVSDDDVASLYNDGDSGDASQIDHIISYWKFEEGSGTSVADEIGSNTATLVNGATFGTY